MTSESYTHKKHNTLFFQPENFIDNFFFCFYRREYLLKFDDKFEVQDDFEVLKRMGLLLGKMFSISFSLIFN